MASCDIFMLFPSFSKAGCHRNPWHHSLPSQLIVCPGAAGESWDGPVMPIYLPGVLGRGNLCTWMSYGAWGTLQNWAALKLNPSTGCSRGGGQGVGYTEIEKGKVKFWMLVTIFCAGILTIKVFYFLFALGNSTESDEESGTRLWVPCAECSDKICEQGKNKGLWLWKFLFLPFPLPDHCCMFGQKIVDVCSTETDISSTKQES